MKARFNISLSRLVPLAMALFMLSALASAVIQPPSASAAQLTDRNLTLSSSANGTINTDIAGNAVSAGAGGNGEKAKHTISFDIGETGNVGSILLMYCTTPIAGTTCTTPTGLSTNTIDSATGFNTQTGFSTNNFSVDTTTSNPTGCNGGSAGSRENCIMINRGAAASETAGTDITIGFGGTSGEYVTNPTTDNETFFIRIQTYSTTTYTTPRDKGTVASSTAQQVDITAKVQEKLNFSVSTTYNAPDGTCSDFTTSSGALALGDANGVLDSGTQYDAHSWFRISTNSVLGAKVFYSGDTLKDGANDINALSSEVTTAAGSEQFGLALNSGEAGHSFTHLVSNVNYNEGNGALGTAKFNYATTSTATPVEIAASPDIVACDTGAVRYIGNIATNTPAGVYTTTVTYIAVPTF